MENNLNQKVTKGETIRELAHRHLLNKNHTTTDEEIKNARIEFSNNPDSSVLALAPLAQADNDTVLPPLTYDDGSDANENIVSDRDKSPLPNPYTVLK
jgi:hypothetical protein